MDPWGRKMSKSMGNGIDADSVLECGVGGRTGSWKIKGPDGKQVQLRANKIGSECFRLWKACEAQVGDDFHINPEEIEAKYYGILTKIFNVARFASQFDVPDDLERPSGNLAPEDRWILSEFDHVMARVEDAWARIDIYSAAQAIKGFGTGIFPSHWLEMTKSRLYEGDEGATWTLHRVVRDLLCAFTPICPFFTHYLSSTLYGKSSVDVRSFPRLPSNAIGKEAESMRALTPVISEFNSMVWKLKKDSGLSLKSPVSDVSIPPELSIIENTLVQMHSIE
jgi:valyl-tRNA synthetase